MKFRLHTKIHTSVQFQRVCQLVRISAPINSHYKQKENLSTREGATCGAILYLHLPRVPLCAG